MSTFTRDDVVGLAHLARLELDEAELARFGSQLAGILEFARQVEAVDTSGVTPLALPPLNLEALRADVVQPSLDRSEVLAAAPGADVARGLFKVPRVLGE